MSPVSIKEARHNLSGLLSAVEHGETVIITRRGKAVARLVPEERRAKPLPDMEDFRKSIKVKGTPLSRQIVEARDAEDGL